MCQWDTYIVTHIYTRKGKADVSELFKVACWLLVRYMQIWLQISQVSPWMTQLS